MASIASLTARHGFLSVIQTSSPSDPPVAMTPSRSRWSLGLPGLLGRRPGLIRQQPGHPRIRQLCQVGGFEDAFEHDAGALVHGPIHAAQ